MKDFINKTENVEKIVEKVDCTVYSKDIDRVYMALMYKLWKEEVATVDDALKYVFREPMNTGRREKFVRKHPEWIRLFKFGNAKIHAFTFERNDPETTNYFSLEVDMQEGQSVLFPLVVFDEKDPRYNDYDYYTLHRGEKVTGTKHGLNVWCTSTLTSTKNVLKRSALGKRGQEI